MRATISVDKRILQIANYPMLLFGQTLVVPETCSRQFLCHCQINLIWRSPFSYSVADFGEPFSGDGYIRILSPLRSLMARATPYSMLPRFTLYLFVF